MLQYLLSLVLLVSCMSRTLATTTISLQNQGCGYEIYNPNQDKSYYLVWDGSHVGSSTCTKGFKGQGSDVFDEYRVCVEAVSFDIECSDTDVEVTYSEGIVAVQKKSYSCMDHPSKWCAGNEQYVDISLKNADSYTLSGGSSFTLKITAERTYNYSATVGAISGSVIGGFILITIICVIIAHRSRRRRYGRITQPGISNPGAVSTITPGSQYPAIPSSYPHSASYPQQSYPQNYNTQYSNFSEGTYIPQNQYPQAPPPPPYH